MRGWLPGVTSVPGEPLYLGRLHQEELSVWFFFVLRAPSFINPHLEIETPRLCFGQIVGTCIRLMMFMGV